MASSEPGFRWPVTAERAIAVPIGKAWDLISMPGNLALCHPFCAANPVHAWPGPDSRDEIHYLNGRVFKRRFRHWIEGVGYDLEVSEFGDVVAGVRWRIRPIGEQACVLGITIFPRLLERVPMAISWLPHLLWMRPRLGSYLDSVTRGFEQYMVSGDAVAREQFGEHPWFSAR